MKWMTKSKLSLYIAVIFFDGAVSGGVVALRKAQAKSQTPSMEKVCHKMQDRLKVKLGLTEQQFETIRPILDRRTEEIQKIHLRTLQDIEAAIRQSHEEMAQYLTEEQKQKLEEMQAERREWLGKRGKRRDRQD